MEAHWKVIEALANGTNPITGEALPSESLYNEPIVIRAMFAVLQDLKQSSKVNKTKRTMSKDSEKMNRMVYQRTQDCLGHRSSASVYLNSFPLVQK
ncbi:hypothetical protein [Vibrio campbellii]|uniref:hypothetical protein n=1 Tax=Vibrio campbellii TaxID=680 RepID=UPI000AC38425|nr:hypothetical protein [Vibrio campbellii]